MQPIDFVLLHVAATWGLVGLIWVVQLVQYPGFALVRGADFDAYHEHHCNRISWVVATLMGTEAVTGVYLYLAPPEGTDTLALHISLALLALNWAITAFVSVPLHSRLRSRVRSAQGPLVATNWIRTAAWTARGVWAFLLLRSLLL